MKRLIVFALLAVILLTGCGRSQVGTEAVGQIKRIVKETPIICPSQTLLDLSMGLLRNGTGSMSTEDLWVRVQTADQEATLKQAQASGQAVKITYDTQRFRLCWHQREVTSVEVLK